MRVLVACEESQAVCIEFRNRGHEAYSCDLQECSGGYPEWHIVGDCLKEAYSGKYDLMIGHPPCTFISYAGTAHWNNPGRLELRLDALNFFAKLWLAPVDKICLENPKGCASPTIAKYSQEIQPYFFGDAEIKTTWLWLKNLPKLINAPIANLFEHRTNVDKPKPKAFNKNGKAIHWSDSFAPSADRGKLRSKTFPGIAKQMAMQWG